MRCWAILACLLVTACQKPPAKNEISQYYPVGRYQMREAPNGGVYILDTRFGQLLICRQSEVTGNTNCVAFNAPEPALR